MYIEVTTRRQGDNAKLQVSVPGNGAAACLVFFYHMYGDAIGTLNVYSGNQLVFSVSGNHGNYWIQARKTIYLRHSVSFWSSVLKKTRLLVLVNFQTAKICTYTYTYTYLQRSVEKPKYIKGSIINELAYPSSFYPFLKDPLWFLRTEIEIMRKMIFSVGDTNRLGNNIRVLLIGVEPCNDPVVSSRDASPLVYKRLVGAILHNARTKSRYVLMRHDRDVF